MRLNDSDIERLLTGQTPDGRADLAQVAAFLSDLPAAYPAVELGPERDEHLYVAAREARLLAAAPAPKARRRTRRLVVTAVAAALGVITTGVGVASAMGADPLVFLPNLLPQPAISARLDTPASVGPGTGATDRPVPPQPTGQPQTDVNNPAGPPQGVPTGPGANNGKDEQAKAEHKPTPKASKTNNGKDEQAKAEHQPSPKPRPTPSNSARTDPPGKTRSAG